MSTCMRPNDDDPDDDDDDDQYMSVIYHFDETLALSFILYSILSIFPFDSK